MFRFARARLSIETMPIIHPLPEVKEAFNPQGLTRWENGNPAIRRVTFNGENELIAQYNKQGEVQHFRWA